MIHWNSIRIIALAGGIALIAWQYLHHARQAQRLEAIEKHAVVSVEEFESRKSVLEDLERKCDALLDDKRAREISITVPLIQERAAAASAISAGQAASAAEKSRAYRKALADTMDDPKQREINRQWLRSEIESRIPPIAKKLGLQPEQSAKLRDLVLDNEMKKGDRVAALLREKVTLAQALQDRELAHAELHRELRALLGDSGYAAYVEINQGEQKGNVERILKWLNKELGSNTLDAGQSARLDTAIRDEFSHVPLDDTDVFRSPQDWNQFVLEHQQNILRQMSPFLTAQQLSALDKLAAEDRAAAEKELASKRKAFGLTSR